MPAKHSKGGQCLESHTGNVADGMPTSPEAGDEHLIVLIDEVEATIPDKSGIANDRYTEILKHLCKVRCSFLYAEQASVESMPGRRAAGLSSYLAMAL